MISVNKPPVIGAIRTLADVKNALENIRVYFSQTISPILFSVIPGGNANLKMKNNMTLQVDESWTLGRVLSQGGNSLSTTQCLQANVGGRDIKLAILESASLSPPPAGGGGWQPEVGEGHITILPWNYSAVVQGTWVIYPSATAIPWIENDSHSQNDQLDFKVYLAVGTYTFKLLYIRETYAAILTLLIDGVSVGTIDCNGSEALNQIGQITGIPISTGGLKTVSIKAATKTGSNWYLLLQSLCFFRTA